MDANPESGSLPADGVLVIRALAQDAERHLFRISMETEPDAEPGTTTVVHADDVLQVVQGWLSALKTRSS